MLHHGEFYFNFFFFFIIVISVIFFFEKRLKKKTDSLRGVEFQQLQHRTDVCNYRLVGKNL